MTRTRLVVVTTWLALAGFALVGAEGTHSHAGTEIGLYDGKCVLAVVAMLPGHALTILIHNGRVLRDNLARERVTLDDLHAALRRAGMVEPAHVRYAVLEENDVISVVPRESAPPPGPLPSR